MNISNRDKKIVLAIICTISALVVVWLRIPKPLHYHADKVLHAYLSGDCRTILNHLSLAEIKATGLDEAEICAFYKDTVFPYTTKAEIKQRLSEQSTGKVGMVKYMILVNEKECSVTCSVFASKPQPVTTIASALNLVCLIRATSDGVPTDSSKFYMIPYLAENLKMMEHHGLRGLYASGGKLTIQSPRLFTKSQEWSLVVNKKFQELRKEGVEADQVGQAILADPEVQNLRRELVSLEWSEQ